MAEPFDVTSDEELERYARDKTSYDSSANELPGTHNDGQMEGVIHDAKRYLYARTGSQQWYNDTAYGQALVTMVALKAKESVENVNIESYGIGDESLSFTNADPDTSQQIVSWSSEVNEMLDISDVEFENSQSLTLKNTANYIG